MTLDPAAELPQELDGPKFNIVTKALSGGTDTETGKRRFKATASSTITDLMGDEIQLAALEKLAQQFRAGVGVFMDHERRTDSAFGVTDGAEIVQRGMDPAGTPVWDLDITGVVNTPNPRAAQLADSIDGGYVKLGASVTAFVRKHLRNPKSGGMLISDLDAIEVSIVGVPENQRSWAQKAAMAVKSYDFDNEVIVKGNPSSSAGEDQEEVVSVEKELDETKVPEPEPEKDKEPETAPLNADSDTGEHADDDASPAEGNSDVQESSQETPETASDDASTDAADAPIVEKAFEVGEVKELVQKVTDLVSEIGRLREEIVQKDATIAAFQKDASALTETVDEAKQVIVKVLGMPLRPRTAGYVEEFTAKNSLFSDTPEIAEYLSKRRHLTNE